MDYEQMFHGIIKIKVGISKRNGIKYETNLHKSKNANISRHCKYNNITIDYTIGLQIFETV